MAARFSTEVLRPDPARRRVILDVLAAAIDAVEPGRAVERALTGRVGGFTVDGEPVDAPDGVTVLAVGKAAPAMAEAAVRTLKSQVVDGVAASPSGDGPAELERVAGSHPTPNATSVAAGEALLRAARRAGRAGAGRVVLVLLSGGGSSIAEVPAAGLTIGDLALTTESLLRCGADIEAVNTVRKHCSALKGGRLGAAAAPARLVTLAISDVVGNRLDVIASGPTVADPTTFADALDVIDRTGAGLPARVLAHLRAGAAGSVAEPPSGPNAFAGQLTSVIADGAAAAHAAVRAARERGIAARIAGTALTGPARDAGVSVVESARRSGRPGMLVWAGETTVEVAGGGRGGRNQEVALSAGIALAGDPDIVVAAVGTDGIDGPTDAAGGIGDGGTVGRGRAAGSDATSALEDNDAYRYLEAAGDLLRCGPTGTNVGDLVVAWRSA